MRGIEQFERSAAGAEGDGLFDPLGEFQGSTPGDIGAPLADHLPLEVDYAPGGALSFDRSVVLDGCANRAAAKEKKHTVGLRRTALRRSDADVCRVERPLPADAKSPIFDSEGISNGQLRSCRAADCDLRI